MKRASEEEYGEDKRGSLRKRGGILSPITSQPQRQYDHYIASMIIMRLKALIMTIVFT